jgi:hypothetical protein
MMSTTASDIYGGLLKDELDRQDARKASFEQRGIAVVTTAGTLVTLLFGLAALSTTTTSQLGDEETVWLGVGLALFVICAACALATNMPAGYGMVRTASVGSLLGANPEHRAEDAQYAVAKARLDILSIADEANSRKGNLLFAALILELLAVVCVGVAIFEVVATSPKPATKHEQAYHAPSAHPWWSHEEPRRHGPRTGRG